MMAETLKKAKGRRGKSSGAQRPAETSSELPPDATQLGHNSQARHDVIVEAINKIRHHEAQIEAIRAGTKKHHQEIGNAYRTLKTQLGMSRKDVERARWLAELEDDEARVSSLSHFKEVYEALRPGETVDWLDAAERAERSREALAQPSSELNGSSRTVDPEDVADAAGFEAGQNGLRAASCPYDQTTQSALHDRWMAAWQRGQGKIAGVGGEASSAGPGSGDSNPFTEAATH
jgi:ribosome modulation factor